MEQTIWVYMGIISVLLAFGIIFFQAKDLREESNINRIEWSLGKYKSDHNFVCSSSIGTRIAVNLDIPTRTILEAEDDRICMAYNKTSDLREEVRCELVDCPFFSTYSLDLHTTVQDMSIQAHNFQCYLERVDDSGVRYVSIDCQG